MIINIKKLKMQIGKSEKTIKFEMNKRKNMRINLMKLTKNLKVVLPSSKKAVKLAKFSRSSKTLVGDNIFR